jgi:hypothetical protein
MRSELHVPAITYQKVLGHLFSNMETEHAAFLYTRISASESTLVLSVEDHFLVPPDGFLRRSAYHFELRDDIQRQVIKGAHSRDCGLVEAHSHPFPTPACFSETDVLGLTDWVPHVRWRLAGRPYAAIVVAPGSFDGIVFSARDTQAVLDTVIVGGIHMRPTGATINDWEALNARK